MINTLQVCSCSRVNRTQMNQEAALPLLILMVEFRLQVMCITGISQPPCLQSFLPFHPLFHRSANICVFVVYFYERTSPYTSRMRHFSAFSRCIFLTQVIHDCRNPIYCCITLLIITSHYPHIIHKCEKN